MWQRLSLKRNAFNALLTFVTSANTFITSENVGKDVISHHFNVFVIWYNPWRNPTLRENVCK
jgi:hypothetical protein